jgi:hypothetical protein
MGNLEIFVNSCAESLPNSFLKVILHITHSLLLLTLWHIFEWWSMKVAFQELGRRLVPPTDHERQVIFEQIRTKVSLFCSK